tara:strand:+ start:2655 stop:3218 length:564 start_codon:yes stop_codon:yes gene_type:complete
MRFNYLLKSIPFLSTLLLIIFLCISNQKELTKLRILIWNTPTLSLGTYLSISTSTGFLLSYFITNKFIKLHQSTPSQSLNYKYENKYNESIENTQSIEEPKYSNYENILIERDIKDPSPTINANFRVIGRKEKIESNLKYNSSIKYNESNDNFSQYAEKDEELYTYNTENKINTKSTDWNDDSFTIW